MESVAYSYDRADAAESPAVSSPLRRSRASQRATVLRRLLLTADVGSALAAGLLAGLVFGIDVRSTAALTLVLIAGLVLIAFTFGLYSDGDLLTWASGLTEAPRALVSALVLAWPVLGAATLLDLPSPALLAISATVATAGFDSVGRALARGWAHRLAPLRQRTVIVGSGMVADRLADRLDRHDEFGLETIGLVDDDVYTPNGGQRLPKLGSLDDLDRVLEESSVDRVIIAFSRASHQQLLSCIRTCRDHRVAVDVVPRLFELLDGAQALNQVGGLPLLSIEAPPLNRSSRVAKRLLDIVALGHDPGRPQPPAAADRDRDQARLARSGLLQTDASRARQQAVQAGQVPLDVPRRRAAQAAVRQVERSHRRGDVQDQA